MRNETHPPCFTTSWKRAVSCDNDALDEKTWSTLTSSAISSNIAMGNFGPRHALHEAATGTITRGFAPKALIQRSPDWGRVSCWDAQSRARPANSGPKIRSKGSSGSLRQLRLTQLAAAEYIGGEPRQCVRVVPACKLVVLELPKDLPVPPQGRPRRRRLRARHANGPSACGAANRKAPSPGTMFGVRRSTLLKRSYATTT